MFLFLHLPDKMLSDYYLLRYNMVLEVNKDDTTKSRDW